jgi:hypothetical protein
MSVYKRATVMKRGEKSMEIRNPGSWKRGEERGNSLPRGMYTFTIIY